MKSVSGSALLDVCGGYFVLNLVWQTLDLILAPGLPTLLSVGDVVLALMLVSFWAWMASRVRQERTTARERSS